jgi:hypothetical protein
MSPVVDFVDDGDPRALGNGIGSVVNGHEILRAVARGGTGGLASVYVDVTAEGDVGAPEPGCNLSGAGTYIGHAVFAR